MAYYENTYHKSLIITSGHIIGPVVIPNIYIPNQHKLIYTLATTDTNEQQEYVTSCRGSYLMYFAINL